MALHVHCDGPDCAARDHLDTKFGWIEVRGADISDLHFCCILCCARYMSTSVALISDPVLPLGQ